MITFISTKVIMGSKDDRLWSQDDLTDDQLWWWSHLLQVAKTKYLYLSPNFELVRVMQFAQFKTKSKTNQIWSSKRGVFLSIPEMRDYGDHKILHCLVRTQQNGWNLKKYWETNIFFPELQLLKKVVLDHLCSFPGYLPISPFTFTFCTT